MDNMQAPRELEMEVDAMRDYFSSEKTKKASWRKNQLKGLLRFLRENQVEMFHALNQDLGKHPAEAYRDEIGSSIKSVNYALDHLKRWMSSKKAKLPRIALLTTAEIVPDPLGVVLVISSWNFPIGLAVEPLIGALAAGNSVVLKPSELAPHCSSLLAKTLPKYLDPEAFKVIEGGMEVGKRLLQMKWDKIFFTGSSRVGRIVMAAAAPNLTPVTLELGGKCPAIVDSLSCSFDRKAAVERILMKFTACAGQVCIAIDYILVEEEFCPILIEMLKVKIKKMFGENPRDSKSMARIVNKNHFLRLKNLLDDNKVKSSIVHGGSMDEANLFIQPTILVNPPLDAEIMTDEIFGPLLPIITLKKIEDSIGFIKSRSKPLAIYAFTKDSKFKRRLVKETSSGSLVFNDSIIQYLVDTLPFGGVGESGLGNYHGKYTFDTFSHHKAVARRSFLVDFWFRFPPWNDNKLELFRSSYEYDYLGIVLTVMGLKKPKSSGINDINH